MSIGQKINLKAVSPKGSRIFVPPSPTLPTAQVVSPIALSTCFSLCAVLFLVCFILPTPSHIKQPDKSTALPTQKQELKPNAKTTPKLSLHNDGNIIVQKKEIILEKRYFFEL